MMNRLMQQVVLAVGGQRALIAFAAGSLGALALPPYGLFPLLVVTMVVAVWLLDGCGGRLGGGFAQGWRPFLSAAIAGWQLGFGYFVLGLYWVGSAFLVDPDQFAWALPLGVIGLPALLACFTALGFILSLLLWRAGGGRIFALAFGLGLSEIARGWAFSGFPWNAFGMALGQYTLFAQTASLYGLYGLTAIAIFLAACPAVLFDARAAHSRALSPVALIGLAGFSVLVGFGAIRLSAVSLGTVSNVKLRIMQPNIPQDAKFRPAASGDILRQYLELSDRSTSPTTAGLADVTHLIWPESAFPLILTREPQALSLIATALAGRTVLLTGAVRVDSTRGKGEGKGEGKGGKAFSAIQIIDSSGHIVDSYDKSHLAPFGDYMPAGGVLRAIGLRPMAAASNGFEPGARRRLGAAPGLPRFLPLIGYEAIFPEAALPVVSANDVEERAGFLLNIANDAWLGKTAGPYQHFAQARLRAIEQGLPMTRAANTGISAVIDPYGRIVKDLPLGVTGVIDAELPKPISTTLFSNHPNTSVALLFVFLLLSVFMIRRNA